MLWRIHNMSEKSIELMNAGISTDYDEGVLLTAGVDEAGRGPLAGPVVAAAVILDPGRPVNGLDDSKALSPRRRSELEIEIQTSAIAWSVGRADADEIDSINILQASLLAMQRAISSLSVSPELALIDGNRCPELTCRSKAVIRGDKIVPAISAASILAKVARDREMLELDRQFPGYGFARHKGYPTRLHIEALSTLGITPVHRVTFRPVRRVIESGTGIKSESN